MGTLVSAEATGAVERAEDAFLMSCSTLQGETLYNRDAQELGELEHVVIDAASGRIAYAVLVRGGVLGLGERFHAIPWEALEIDAGGRRFVLDIDVDRLDSAPGFDDEHWPAMNDMAWSRAVREFYAANPRDSRRRAG
jgi:sporulation protein YlmC with PRC-barrel domain